MFEKILKCQNALKAKIKKRNLCSKVGFTLFFGKNLYLIIPSKKQNINTNFNIDFKETNELLSDADNAMHYICVKYIYVDDFKDKLLIQILSNNNLS